MSVEPSPAGADVVAPSWLSGGRVPGLDGLRAVSILMVVGYHAISTRGFNLPSSIGGLLELGFFGVDVFFVISGFLITLLLLREHERTAGVSLRGFYWRRALRILPAYAAYLLFIAALASGRSLHPTPIDWAASLTYTVDFLTEPCWPLGHIWSLSVEEQFYLLWPLTLALLGPRRAARALIAVVVACSVARFVVSRHLVGVVPVNLITPLKIDTIGFGCLAAYAARDARWWPVLGRMGRWAGAVVAASVGVIALSEVMRSYSWTYSLALASGVKGIAIAAVILACAMAPRGSWVGRLLGSWPMVQVGVLSYSLYLWQQPFLWPVGREGPGPALGRLPFPFNVLLAMAAATTCHLLVERPILKWKDRMSERRHASTSLPEDALPATS